MSANPFVVDKGKEACLHCPQSRIFCPNCFHGGKDITEELRETKKGFDMAHDNDFAEFVDILDDAYSKLAETVVKHADTIKKAFESIGQIVIRDGSFDISCRKQCVLHKDHYCGEDESGGKYRIVGLAVSACNKPCGIIDSNKIRWKSATSIIIDDLVAEFDTDKARERLRKFIYGLKQEDINSGKAKIFIDDEETVVSDGDRFYFKSGKVWWEGFFGKPGASRTQIFVNGVKINVSDGDRLHTRVEDGGDAK